LHKELFEDNVYFKHGISLADDAVVIDCGANIGMTNIFIQHEFAARRPQVYCFEPVGGTYALLEKNCEAFGGRCFNYGLSDAAAIVRFEIGHTNITASGCSDFNQWRTDNWHKAIGETSGQGAKMLDYLRRSMPVFKHLPLPVFRAAAKLQLFVTSLTKVRTSGYLRPLSEVVAELGIQRIDLLKVDVEGAEMAVLRGISAADWAIIEQVVMEVQTHAYKAEALALLEKHNFEVVIEQDPHRPDYLENFGLWAKKRGRK